jgi:hypothetical protein
MITTINDSQASALSFYEAPRLLRASYPPTAVEDRSSRIFRQPRRLLIDIYALPKLTPSEQTRWGTRHFESARDLPSMSPRAFSLPQIPNRPNS